MTRKEVINYGGPIGVPKGRVRLLAISVAMVLAVPGPVAAGGLAGAIERGAAKALSKRSLFRLFARDARIHARTLVRPLEQPRTVFRFTSKSEAARSLRTGVAPDRHLTAGGGAGRPLGAAAATRRYGLPRPPEARITIRLPKGQPVQPHKVVGGARGVGTIASPRGIPAQSVRRVVPIP